MTLRKSRKILLLGELSTARVLGRSAEACGLEPVYHALRQDYPRLAKRDFNSLREVLRVFAEESAARPAAGSTNGHDDRLSDGNGDKYGGHGLVHPGTSPWGERVELLAYCQELGLTAVAPAARLLSLFDHKLGFLMEVERLGLHHLSLSFDPFSSVREIQRFIKKNHQSFPFVLKSAVGGGQFGVYTVQGPLSLGQDFTLWLEQLRYNLGEVILFPEKYLESSRHLSVPFVRFNSGQSGKSKIQIFPIVDGSLQSRFRKLVEICPPYRVDSEILEKVTRWTKHIADSLGYVGFGTIEFLVDGDRAFVIGGQTRLNTSFHLWEQVAGVSILEWQLAALGTEEFKSPLKGVLPKAEWRHGLSVRICAEDSLFHLPQPGTVTEVTQQVDSRIQMSYAQGESLHSSVPAETSGILANVQVVDNHWNSARNQMLKLLDQLWIAGSLETNERMIRELLNHPWVREGIYHSGFVDEEFLPQVLPEPAFLELMAGVCSWHQRNSGGDTDSKPYAILSSTPDLKVNETPHPNGEDLSNRWMVGERWIKSSRSIADPI